MGRSRRHYSSHNKFDSSAASPTKPKFHYRVIMRRAAKSPQVVWMTSDCDYARSIAVHLNSVVSTDVAWVEEWKDSIGRGQWRRVLETAPLFHRVAPKPGEHVKAVLLDNRTRRGGWKAKLLGFDLEGHITNSVDVPSSAVPGLFVELQVGAVNRNGTHLQLTWL